MAYVPSLVLLPDLLNFPIPGTFKSLVGNDLILKSELLVISETIFFIFGSITFLAELFISGNLELIFTISNLQLMQN